jgi:hypothetical protein
MRDKRNEKRHVPSWIGSIILRCSEVRFFGNTPK